jgi:trehalose/maltose hydrolase-like predicted phosphorylase
VITKLGTARDADVEVEEPGGLERVVAEVLFERPPADQSPWLLVVPSGPPSMSRVYESLLTVADGITGTRGSLEEDGTDASPAVFVSGLYDTRDGGAESLLVVRSWTTLALNGSFSTGERVLDLLSGVLWRMAGAEDAELFSSARWACLARPGTTVLVAEGSSSVLEVPAAHEVTEDRASSGGGVVQVIDTSTEAHPDSRGGPSTLHVVRIGTYQVAARRAPSRSRAAARQEAACRAGPAELLAEQRVAWASRWAEADVEVVGNPELTLSVRLALFHLMSSVAGSGEAAVGARGLTGPSYAGHVFWDADVFVLPFMAATHPRAARAMLEYRIRRVPSAIEAASTLGRRGARFPWESAHDGCDVTPKSGVNQHGEIVPIRTGELEEHITADVAWAAWQLASWSGRWRFLEGPGRPLLVETARYWASRARLDDAGVGHIESVTGPDEYHENVNDNAFTNQMAAWNLARAAELVERTGAASELDEAIQWRGLSEALFDGYDPGTGRHEQFAGYDDLQPIFVSELGPVPVAADLLLGHDGVARSQIIKQADVLMAHHMIPDALRPGTLEHDLDFYLLRTAHGSSLSPAVHASVLARQGRLDEALSLLDLTQNIDLDDVTGTTAGGLHLAALGGLWQAFVLGFAGVRVSGPDAEALVLDPHIPTQWRELRLKLRWHGRRICLRCRSDAIHVACATPLKVRLGDREPVVVRPPEAWVEREASRPLSQGRGKEVLR